VQLALGKRLIPKAGVLPDGVQQFRVFFKILAKYKKGNQLLWFPRLNSFPKLSNNGASMTYDCFNILLPYAAFCAMVYRLQLLNFQKVIRPLGGPSKASFRQNILEDK
jgi:hypothetical protein